MHILQVLHQYLPEHVGGVELYTRSLSCALARRGHEVSIFHRRSAEGVGMSRQEAEHGPVYGVWHGRFEPSRRLLATFHDRPLLEAFEQVLDETTPEVVHIEHLMGLPAEMTEALALRDIPYAVTLWDFWWVCANAQLLTNYSGALCAGPAAFLNCARCALARAGRQQFAPALPPLAVPLALRNRRLGRVLRSARQLIAPAAFVGDWYAAHGVPAGRMAVIPPGLDDAGQPDEAGQATARPFRIGYVGGLAPQKGVHVLLEAFGRLPAGAELWFAGDPGTDPGYFSQLEATAVPGVTFLGRVERPGLWQMLSQVDVVVVPSLWYETFVFVISEAFAAGVPVIASNIGVMAERVRDGLDGLLVPPGDAAALSTALQRLRESPALLAALREGIGSVRTMDEHAAEIEGVYEAIGV